MRGAWGEAAPFAQQLATSTAVADDDNSRSLTLHH
jgi:hypothetical protein